MKFDETCWKWVFSRHIFAETLNSPSCCAGDRNLVSSSSESWVDRGEMFDVCSDVWSLQSETNRPCDRSCQVPPAPLIFFFHLLYTLDPLCSVFTPFFCCFSFLFHIDTFLLQRNWPLNNQGSQSEDKWLKFCLHDLLFVWTMNGSSLFIHFPVSPVQICHNSQFDFSHIVRWWQVAVPAWIAETVTTLKFI